MYEAKVLADSIGPSGARLTTMQVTFPRIVLAEVNTHRALSRNSASSRAIPVERMLRRVEDDPFIPIHWGKNQKGMQADEFLDATDQIAAEEEWLRARDAAVESVRELLALGLHKQIANRLLEPWLWHTAIISATDWSNFFALRCHKDAQPEIQQAALMMRAARNASTPVRKYLGEWHLPLVGTERDDVTIWDCPIEVVCKISVGRCARVSYLTHDGKRDPQADIDLCDRLQASGHMSPFEHVAQALSSPTRNGNFSGWLQLRKMLPNEAVFGGGEP